jgi:hypothetical protein
MTGANVTDLFERVFLKLGQIERLGDHQLVPAFIVRRTLT